MIKKIEEIVEQACAQDTNIFGYGIWTHHITQVAKNGKQLANLFKADEEIVEIAALLHDYASVKDEALYENHHITGPIEAEKILKQLGYASSKIEAVKHCISTHRGSVQSEKRSAEAECLANADALTHIEQIPSLFYLVFVEKGMGIDEGSKWVLEKLKRSWNKLSPPVQEMMKLKYTAVVNTLSSFENGTE
jgi:hypothetical protein